MWRPCGATNPRTSGKSGDHRQRGRGAGARSIRRRRVLLGQGGGRLATTWERRRAGEDPPRPGVGSQRPGAAYPRASHPDAPQAAYASGPGACAQDGTVEPVFGQIKAGPGLPAVPAAGPSGLRTGARDWQRTGPAHRPGSTCNLLTVWSRPGCGEGAWPVGQQVCRGYNRAWPRDCSLGKSLLATGAPAAQAQASGMRMACGRAASPTVSYPRPGPSLALGHRLVEAGHPSQLRPKPPGASNCRPPSLTWTFLPCWRSWKTLPGACSRPGCPRPGLASSNRCSPSGNVSGCQPHGHRRGDGPGRHGVSATAGAQPGSGRIGTGPCTPRPERAVGPIRWP